ncbi:T9SS type A sorting domain-containing protein [Polaribacter vadi]|uniref:T9SS type A sorting domain-containing protein n=1 Tax=Polaribacter vadi TaxID=1774273 RepID=UPI0030EF0628|tara:strand:+ start:16999 stop:19170 length:2172 start_codon:yes stop_codon:yes gene_type:complete
MNRKLQNKAFYLFAFIAFISLSSNAQTAWEFTDSATGTDVWVPTNLTTTQGKHITTYTTTGAADPEINTTALGLVVGTDATLAVSHRIIGITIRVSTGGPDYIRVSHPDDTNADGTRHITNLQIIADGKWRTYALDLANTPDYRTDWTGTENDIKITFRTYDAGDPTGTAYTTAGATVEVDRIEFVSNAWINDTSNGASNDNYGNSGNWVLQGTQRPTHADSGNDLDILIPTGDGTQQPNINVNIAVGKLRTLHIGAGAKLDNTSAQNVGPSTLILSPGASFNANSGGNFSDLGTVIVKVDIPDTDWHLISSPLNVEQFDDTWIISNGIASGTGNNRGISTYNNGTPDGITGHWRYFQAGGTATNFTLGIGYSLKRGSKGLYVFEGENLVSAESISPTISQGGAGGTNWNLIGSPYIAHLNAATFIADNLGTFPVASQAIYVWNGITYTSLTTGDLSVGQAFFINNDSGATTATFNAASHSLDSDNSAVFYKNNNTTVTLSLTSDNKTLNTFISYLDGKTKDLNPGFDISLFDGVPSDFSVYTHLLENNEGIAFERQALPNSDLESMVVPVGVKVTGTKEITFIAEATNIPSGLNVYLEDRQENIFTQLGEANSAYKVSVTEASNGIGRFYLHTSAKSALSTEDVVLNSVSIYKSDKSTLKIAGLSQGKASISLFNVLGKNVMNSSFEVNGVKEISLPNLATGVYVVQLTTEEGKLNKKIILE